MTLYRLNRLFNPRSGRALDVAVDHGFFGEPSFITGIEDMREVVATLVAREPRRHPAHPRPGPAPAGRPRQGQAGAGACAPTSPTSTATRSTATCSAIHVPHAIEEAVRLDAVAVCVNLLHLPGHPEIREASIRSIMALRKEATRYGMPLMVEPLVMQDNATAGGGYMVDGDTAKIVTLVRQAAELGADLIKADPTDDDRGLPPGDRRSRATSRSSCAAAAGSTTGPSSSARRPSSSRARSGIVYGRNVDPAREPAGITAALMSVLHDGASVDDALATLARTRA